MIDNAEYSVGHDTARRLARLVTSPDERAALERLEAFAGTADDLRLVVSAARRAGQNELADSMIGTGDA